MAAGLAQASQEPFLRATPGATLAPAWASSAHEHDPGLGVRRGGGCKTLLVSQKGFYFKSLTSWRKATWSYFQEWLKKDQLLMKTKHSEIKS